MGEDGFGKDFGEASARGLVSLHRPLAGPFPDLSICASVRNMAGTLLGAWMGGGVCGGGNS